MTSTSDQLTVLRRLRNEGQISDQEYETLAGGLHRPRVDNPAQTVDDTDQLAGRHMEADFAVASAENPDVAQAVEDQPLDAGRNVAEEQSPDALGAFLQPKFRGSLSKNYLIGLFIAAAALLLVSLLGAMPWLVSITAILVLVSTLFEGWGKVTLVGAAVAAVMLVIGLLSSTADVPESVDRAAATPPVEDPHPAIAGSLGIYMDQVADLWNGVDGPPRITRGLTRHTEIGEYDTFIYRWGDWGRLAGAFDPDNEAIYALLVSGQFSDGSTDQLYFHLCFVLAPYSQDCVDSFNEQGLDGGTLGDFTDMRHEAEWAVGEHTWRLEIDENVMTIRVYGRDAA